jgi:hypothetical protein
MRSYYSAKDGFQRSRAGTLPRTLLANLRKNFTEQVSLAETRNAFAPRGKQWGIFRTNLPTAKPLSQIGNKVGFLRHPPERG